MAFLPYLLLKVVAVKVERLNGSLKNWLKDLPRLTKSVSATHPPPSIANIECMKIGAGNGARDGKIGLQCYHTFALCHIWNVVSVHNCSIESGLATLFVSCLTVVCTLPSTPRPSSQVFLQCIFRQVEGKFSALKNTQHSSKEIIWKRFQYLSTIFIIQF